jgi:hypothetical protein
MSWPTPIESVTVTFNGVSHEGKYYVCPIHRKQGSRKRAKAESVVPANVYLWPMLEALVEEFRYACLTINCAP